MYLSIDKPVHGKISPDFNFSFFPISSLGIVFLKLISHKYIQQFIYSFLKELMVISVSSLHTTVLSLLLKLEESFELPKDIQVSQQYRYPWNSDYTATLNN